MFDVNLYERRVESAKKLYKNYQGKNKKAVDIRNNLCDLAIRVREYTPLTKFLSDFAPDGSLNYQTFNSWIVHRDKKSVQDLELEIIKKGKAVDPSAIIRTRDRADKESTLTDVKKIYNEEVKKSKEDVKFEGFVKRLAHLSDFITGHILLKLNTETTLNVYRLSLKITREIEKQIQGKDGELWNQMTKTQ